MFLGRSLFAAASVLVELSSLAYARPEASLIIVTNLQQVEHNGRIAAGISHDWGIRARNLKTCTSHRRHRRAYARELGLCRATRRRGEHPAV
ncbi:hypothetical protein PsYK624_118170 [Phanerochaete sordida]|uniref:Uncharacterized protein n=1 Tax=Phanerochaete sordida TaxID=48140 RepID=A0A9P3GIL0_9APHY|nr:hypothetical protein PsYK624_118170 [Phanerochaete sordida]